MAIKRHQGKWRVDIRIKGQRIRKNFKSRRLAEIYHARIEQKKIELLYPTIIPHHIPLSEFCKKILDHTQINYCRNTFLSYRYCLNAFISYYTTDPYIHTITPIEIFDFLQSLPQLSPRTYNERVKVLKSIFNKAQTWGYLSTIPTVNLKTKPTSPRVPIWIDKEKLSTLLHHAPIHLQLILNIAYYTGMRRGEILGLTWDNVELSKRRIIVKSGKTKSIRIVPIHSVLIEILKKTQKLKGFVCCYKDKKITSNFYSSLSTLQKTTGIKFNFHDLRHSFALNALYAGIPLSVVRDILGHTNIKTTSRYLPYIESVGIIEIEKIPH